MKTEILFLIALLVGFNPQVRSIHNDNRTLITDDEILNKEKCMMISKEQKDWMRATFGQGSFTPPVTTPGSGDGSCFWLGIQMHSVTERSISLFWTFNKNNTFTVRRKYIKGAKYWEHPSDKWVTVRTNMSGGGLKIEGLGSGYTYMIEVIQTCSGKIRNTDTKTYTTLSESGSKSVSCTPVKNLRTGRITQTSAFVDGEFTSANDYLEATYEIRVWEDNNPTHDVIYRVIARVVGYDLLGMELGGKDDKPLKPYTDYSYRIYQKCKEMLWPWNFYITDVPPGVMHFRTLPPDTGACGCWQGNRTVFYTQERGLTHFYCGEVTSKEDLYEENSTTTFKGTLVQLNPGFETHISGTGSFVAVAFDPNTCQESAAAFAQKGQKSVSKMAAPDNSLSNTKVVAPKKYKVYPNPNRGSFSIDFRKKNEVIKSITVYDMFGIRILHKRYNRRLDTEQYSLRLAKSGLYKIAIRSARGIAYETLLVEF